MVQKATSNRPINERSTSRPAFTSEFSRTMKFCCRGDQEYMTGTEATAFRVFRGMTCLGNSEKLLSTVHWRQTRRHNKCAPSQPPPHTRAHLSGASQRAHRRHDVNRLDPPRLPLLVQNISSLHDLLTVGAEHGLQGGQNKRSVPKRERERDAFLTAENQYKAWLGAGLVPWTSTDGGSMSCSGLNFKTVDINVHIKNNTFMERKHRCFTFTHVSMLLRDCLV